MGYTHYWTIQRDCPQELYNKALIACRKIIKKCTKEYNLCGGYGEPGTLPDLTDGLSFNGCGDECHETFLLESSGPWVSNFCKTARKEYDPIVVACLAAMKHILKDNVKVSSDGDREEWEHGTNIAGFILKKDIANPNRIV